MNLTDILGYAAAFLVLLTFSMKTMVQLRVVGILSNVFFIGYSYFAKAQPIMILHLILLPLNIFVCSRFSRSFGKSKARSRAI